MPRWRSQDYFCDDGEGKEGCGWRDSELIPIEEGQPYSEDSCPASVPCPLCERPAVRLFSAPAIMTRSLPDGTFRGEGWQLTKEAAKLKLRRKRTKGTAEKAEITKEIDRLNKTVVQRNYKDTGAAT